ncbi:hypothetical protein [Tenacibaculum sp. M341]|uniref:hypothetical protein n=1 Tax=Tenacibaculum sp. M341 TaxID=2530339 RepID=UPI00104E313F|nr:hypothetical protein [Tenacibaculum sp. M341]TCI92700.1 hypothetical protein EYW44_07320 [Tenacibaculum sp. M341]
MFRRSFPKCEVKGSYTPVKYGHMFSEGAIPQKCSTCSNLFEGECLRGLDKIERLLRLDYNHCGVNGSSEPTEIEKLNDNSIYVPKKCVECKFLKKSTIRQYFCNKEHEIWKDFPRDLDWGNWHPDYPLVGIRKVDKYKNINLGPAIITKDLILLLLNKETTKAMKLYRKLNNIPTIIEAIDDIKKLTQKLELD